MYRPLIIVLLVNLFFFHSAHAQFHISEKKVNKNKISKHIINYVEENYKGSAAKYYKLKTDKDSIFYEVKVKSNEGIINLIFNQNSELIRIDNEVHYFDVPEEIRENINKNLSDKFSTYKVTNCKDQKLGNIKIYELDVIAKKKRYKFRFKIDGSLIDYKELPQNPIGSIFH